MGQFVFYSFCLITLVQLFYYIYFFTRLALYKSKQKSSSQSHAVSVIICARDEANNLANNLVGSLAQKYTTTHEVIVVDDNSFDDSKYLLEAFAKQYKQLNVVSLKQEAKFIPGKKFPLSMGIKSAKYEIVLLTDADCVPATDLWIDKMQETYDDQTEIVLGYGAYHKKRGLLNAIVRWETFHTALQYFSYALAGKPYMGVGRNLSYKKTIFFRHKGFSAHNNIPSGDDDLFINLAATKTNTKINIDPDTFTLSEPPTTWKAWIKQKHRHYSTGKYYTPLHQFLLGLYSGTHFLFYPFLIASLFLFHVQWVAIVFTIRLLLQGFVFYSTMKKLKEQSLFPWYWLIDMGMFFYYLFFVFALFKKPKPSWK